MDAHHIRRLPVIDRGKLVGIVTGEALDGTEPSQLTTFMCMSLATLLTELP